MTLVLAAKTACVPSQVEDRISKGFKAVEIITFENQLKDSFGLMQRILNDYSNSLDVISIHAPSELTISDAIDENYRKRGLSCLQSVIRLAAKADCDHVVFHGFQHITKLSTVEEMISLRERAFERCVEGIRSLDPFCEDLGVTLFLENINACLYLDKMLYIVFTASPYDLLRVVEEIDSNHLKLCFDVAHAQNTCNFILQNPEIKALFNVDKLAVEEFCEMIIDHVELMHLSDAKGAVAGKGTDNLPLGKGEIDFRRVLQPILARGSRPPIVLEIDETDINNAENMVKAREFLSRIIAQ